MALAQFERELTAERIKNNLHARALRGLFNGGSPILGYDRDPQNPGRLIINDDEAHIVKEAFNLYFEANGLASVAHKLNGHGFRNKAWMSRTGHLRGGKEFDIDALWRILTNVSYAGKREVNRGHKDLDQDQLRPEDKYDVVNAAWDAIIDDETFNRVQCKLKANKGKKYSVNYDFFLTGILVCDECGHALCGQTATGRMKKHFYYGHSVKNRCRIQRYRAEELERLIKKNLFSFLNNKELKQEFLDGLSADIRNGPQFLKSLLSVKETEARRLTTELEALTTLVADNPLAKKTNALLVKIQEKEEKLERMREEIENLKENSSLEEAESIDPQFILQGIDKLRKDNFRKAGNNKKKSIVQSVIKSIHIHPENLLKIDFWPTEFKSEHERKKARGQKGVVLPFRKHGRSLAASLKMGVASAKEYQEVKKAMGMEMAFVYSKQHSPVALNRVGSPIVNGAPRVTMVETATENPQTVKWAIPLDERKRPPVDLEKLAKLKWTDGHSHGEIARIMRRSRNTIDSAIRRVSSGKAAYKRMK